MDHDARLMSGILFTTVPTIQYGGYFLLTLLIRVHHKKLGLALPTSVGWQWLNAKANNEDSH